MWYYLTMYIFCEKDVQLIKTLEPEERYKKQLGKNDF